LQVGHLTIGYSLITQQQKGTKSAKKKRQKMRFWSPGERVNLTKRGDLMWAAHPCP
jgi:hypothetical protein